MKDFLLLLFLVMIGLILGAQASSLIRDQGVEI
jgi:hypothetical protein